MHCFHVECHVSSMNWRSSSSSFDCGSELTLERANAHMAITAWTEEEYLNTRDYSPISTACCISYFS